MQSLKGETDTLYATIKRFEEATREFVARADQVNPITENLNSTHLVRFFNGNVYFIKVAI